MIRTEQPQTENVPISKIAVGERHRRINPDAVKTVAASIAEIGLISPIIVVRDGDEYRLVAGRHRLEACRSLGHDEIRAFVHDLNPVDAELLELDGNLVRSDLSVLEQAEHLARRDALL